MKVNSLFFLLPLFVLACTGKQNSDRSGETDSTVVSDSSAREDIASSFSELYTDTTFREMYIYPNKKFDDSTYRFWGKRISENNLKIFNQTALKGLSAIDGFYGVYSFSVDQNTSGLITRTPDMYTSSRISLWVYDRQSRHISHNVELANRFGDAGAVEESRSYIFFDDEKILNVLTHQFNSVDLRVNTPPVDRVVDKHAFILTQFRNGTPDTVSRDSIALHKRFGPQLNKLKAL